MTTVNIWVSAGDLNAPFYRYYIDASGTTELVELSLNSFNSYTFQRLDEATTHPFYIKSDSDNPEETSSYRLTGDGNAGVGITGNQSFTLSFDDPNQTPESIATYCTAHPSMQSVWNITQSSEIQPEPTPEPQPGSYEPPTTKNEIKGKKKNDNLIGTKKSDSIHGKKGDDTLIGNQASDVLKGGSGLDVLKGSKGDDYLDGSKGNDILNGGKGADVFQISKGYDLIKDFDIMQGDRIALDKNGSFTIMCEDPDGVLITANAKKQLFLERANYDDVIAAGIDLFVQPF